MTQRRYSQPIRVVSETKTPKSGLDFVFSDNLDHWMISQNVSAVAKQRARDRAKAQFNGRKKSK